MNTKRTLWTPDREAWLRGFTPGHTERETIEEFEHEFGIRLTRTQLKNGKAKLGLRSGTVGGRFEKGHVPANKGKKWDEFMPPESQERCRGTQYKPGNVPHNALDKPVGYERMAKDGYIQVKVKDERQEKANDNFRFKHHVVWEEANGKPVPPGTMIVFADHDKLNFDPGNLVAVPRGIWATIQRCGLEYSDRETLEVAVNIAKLVSARRKVELRPRTCKCCGSEFKPRHSNQRRCDECIGAGVVA